MGQENKNPCSRCYGTGHLQSVVGRRKCHRCNGTGHQENESSRRSFIGGVMALAAGAAVGIPLAKGIREVGPVDLSFYLFSEKPHVIPVSLMSDQARDIFTIRTLEKDVDVQVSMPLSKVKAIVSFYEQHVFVHVTCKSEENKSQIRNMSIVRSGSGVHLNMSIENTPTFWMKLSDVNQALFA